jgi:hypothetical protein
MVKKETTEVTKWLKENHAVKYIDAFFKAGCYDKADVTEAAITKIVPEKEGGVRQRLLRSLVPKAQEPPPPIPELKPGTALDLSAPQISIADGVTFQLPTHLSVGVVGGGKVIAPDQLKPLDWMVLAKRSKLLYGYRADVTDVKDAESARATRPPHVESTRIG